MAKNQKNQGFAAIRDVVSSSRFRESRILDELGECVEETHNTEKEIEYQELVNAINKFLASLPEDKRNIFVCRYWYSDSVGSIARAYGMKENAVSMLLGRLRNKLHAYLLEGRFEV